MDVYINYIEREKDRIRSGLTVCKPSRRLLRYEGRFLLFVQYRERMRIENLMNFLYKEIMLCPEAQKNTRLVANELKTRLTNWATKETMRQAQF